MRNEIGEGISAFCDEVARLRDINAVLLSALEQVRDNNRDGVKGINARRAWIAANDAIAKARGE